MYCQSAPLFATRFHKAVKQMVKARRRPKKRQELNDTELIEENFDSLK